MDMASLQEAGLTNGESKVYIALLELGPSTTGPIVNKSAIARSIIYHILEKLMQKGLVSYVTKEKRKYFQAANPRKILEYIEERDLLLHENKSYIEEKILPQLMLKMQSAKRNEATIYTGFKGIRAAFEQLYTKLKKGQEYCWMGIHKFQPKEQHLYWKKDNLRRIKAGITCKLLFNRDTDAKILRDRNSYKGNDSRYMPTNVSTPASFGMYKDTTLIVIQYPHAIAIEIFNQEITDTFQTYFDEFWKRSKPFR